MTEPPHLPDCDDPIIALVPAFNEETRIGAVLEKTLPRLPVLVVDDGSSDDTSGVARRLGAEVLVQSPNRGKGAALKAGFQEALRRGVQAVVTLDADGQHDPDEIPSFLAALRARPVDLIIGSRDFSKMPKLRKLSNGMGRMLFSWALGRRVADNQSGYRLISSRLMAAMVESEEEGFELEVEMIVSCVRLGFSLGSVPIRTIYAGETSHINNTEHFFEFMRILWKTWRSRRGRKGLSRPGTVG